MKSILIFGAGKIADVAYYFMAEKSDLPVIGFVVEDRFWSENSSLNGKSIYSYSQAKQHFNPENTDFFVAIGYHDLNRVRSRIIHQLRSDGFSITSYIDADSGVPSDLIYGENTFIMSQVCIQPRVKLGEDNFIWSGAMIGHHSTIGSHNWLTSGVQIGGNVTMGNHNFFGLSAVVSHSVPIGNENFFGANTLITKEVQSQQVFIQESTKSFRLTSDQFLRFSNFGGL